MTETPECYYHILHPDDDVNEQLEMYKKLYPDREVYMNPGMLTIMDRKGQKRPIRLMVIVCEAV